MNACHEKDKQAWVDNFADDALIEDPIGRSPLDPEGKGASRGKDAISRFWDNQIAPTPHPLQHSRVVRRRQRCART
jgi:hypothetical protein